MPLIKKVALTERNTLINETAVPRALPGAMGNIWAYSPPQLVLSHTKNLGLRGALPAQPEVFFIG